MADPTTPPGAGGDAGAMPEEPTGAEEIISSGGMTTAALVAVAAVVVAAAGGIAYWLYKRQTEPNFLEAIGQQYDLQLAPEVEEFELVKEKCGGDEIQLKQALMKRCVADVPMLQFMQGEERKVQRMYSSSMIGEKSHQSFQDAMAIASEELEAVKAEADEIQPGWGEQIWQQGMHLHTHLKSMQEHQEKAQKDEEEAAAEKKKQAKKEKEAEKSAQTSEADAEKLAEQKAAELIKEAEEEAGSTGLKKRKSSKKKKPEA